MTSIPPAPSSRIAWFASASKAVMAFTLALGRMTRMPSRSATSSGRGGIADLTAWVTSTGRAPRPEWNR